MKKLFNIEAAFGLFLYLLAIFVFVSARSFPHVEWRHGGSPGFYPEILVVLLVIFATIMVWFGLKNPLEPVAVSNKKIIIMLFVAVLLLLTPMLFRFFGFLITSVVIVFLLALAFQEWKVNVRRIVESILASLVGTGLIYIVFQYGAKVVLPRGTLF